MERSEPTLVPQWLRSGGRLTGGGTTTHPSASSSSLHSDDRVASNLARNKSLVNKNDHSLGRTASSYFRRSSSNSSVNLRPSSSSGRDKRGKEWDKDIYELRNKDEPILGDRSRWGYTDPLEDISSSRVGKEGLMRSHSMISEGRREVRLRKIVADSSYTDRNGNVDGSDSLAKSNKHKTAFGEGFSSLGEKEKSASEIGRLPSPGLSSPIHSLPAATSAMVGGDKWKSALAEVPTAVGSNDIITNSPSLSLSRHTGLNMAETVAQGPSRPQTPPQLSVETQRLEELAIKQSRQLIPVTPSVPKALGLNPSEKLKTKVGQQYHPIGSSNLASHSSRGGPVRADLSRAPSAGKLHVLKPTWERNGVSPAAKDGSSPRNGGKVANSKLAAAPLIAESPAMKSPAHISMHPATERKPVLPLLEKRPTSQAQSRNEFFNLVRKKSVGNSSSVADAAHAGLSSCLKKPNELEDAASLTKTDDAASPTTQQSGDAMLSDNPSRGENGLENKGDRTSNGNSSFGKDCSDNGKSTSSFDLNFFSEEEEAAFLRSLGWEENADEGGLTEEEINAFYEDVTKYIDSKPSWKILQGAQPRFLSPLGSVAAVSSGLASSNSKLES